MCLQVSNVKLSLTNLRRQSKILFFPVFADARGLEEISDEDLGTETEVLALEIPDTAFFKILQWKRAINIYGASEVRKRTYPQYVRILLEPLSTWCKVGNFAADSGFGIFSYECFAAPTGVQGLFQFVRFHGGIFTDAVA